MITIHGELTASGDQIVLIAGGLGPVEELAEAGKLLQFLTPLFSRSDPPGAMLVPTTWAVVVQLSTTFGVRWAPGPRLQAWVLEQARQRTTRGELAYRPPAGLELRDYQVTGAQLIAATGRALITDEPRTGKTITTVAGLVERAARTGQAGPVLVICPASVVDPWVEAWQTWAPHVRAVAWRGAPKARHALAGTADVYVTSYDTARVDTPQVAKSSPLRKLDAQHLVVDECHYIKNPKTARSQSIMRLAREVTRREGSVIGLSGTPITHHPGDLWPMLYAMEPEAWPARNRWVQRYCDVLPGTDGDAQILGLSAHRETEFRVSLLGQQRRVARADVMAQLPPKVYSVRTVELPAAWRKAYDAMEAQMLAELPDGTEMSVMSVLAKLTRLSQLASAPATVTETGEISEDGTPKVTVSLMSPSWKVDALLEILDERPGEQVVVFAPSRQLIDLAGKAAETAGHSVGYVVGGQSAKTRTETIRAFQNREINVVCATTDAGGEGITLSAAGTLVFLQRPWSLVKSIQAEDRGEGDMNATRGTEIIDVVASGTVDTRVRAVLRERAGQLADLLRDPRIVAELLGGRDVQRQAA